MRLFWLALLLVVGSAAGALECSRYESQLGGLIGSEMPNFVPIGDEVVYGIDYDGSVIGEVVIQDRKVTSFSCEPGDAATYTLRFTKPTTIQDLLVNPTQDALLEKYRRREIVFEGVGFWNSLKVAVASFFFDMKQMFS